MPDNKVLHVFSDGTDTYVAYDLADAVKAWEEHCREVRSPDDWDEFYPLADHDLITIYCEDELPDPMPEGAEEISAGRYRAFASAWAKANGRGFLCSTEY